MEDLSNPYQQEPTVLHLCVRHKEHHSLILLIYTDYTAKQEWKRRLYETNCVPIQGPSPS